MKSEDIIKNYLEALQSEFECLPGNKDRLRIITPYLYPDHDRIEIYIREQKDEVVVSDLGETLRRLDTLGMDIASNTSKMFQATHIADGLKVSINDGVIFKRGLKDQVGNLLFDVLTACKGIGDLIYGSRAYEPATFEAEVSKYLQERKYSVETRVAVFGISGSKYRVGLKVKTKEQEALIAPVSPKSPGGIRNQINAVFRMWSDVNHNSWKISLLNDIDFVFRKEDAILLQRVSLIHYWTQKDKFVSALSEGFNEKTSF